MFENKDLKTTNQSLSKKAEWLETELAISKHNCALLKNAIYGKQSEKLKNSYTDQMSFLFNEAEIYAQVTSEPLDQEEESSKVQSLNKAERKALPTSLPCEEIIHELKGDELKCNCGGQLIHIGSEESEQLDVIPDKIIVKKHIRYKYACKSCQECVKRAPAPFSPIDKAIATSNLLAHICLRNLMIILHYIDKNVYGKD